MDLQWPWFALWGCVGLSLILARNNSQTFAKTFNRSESLNRELAVKNQEVEALNSSLEQKVEERTAEVKSLLTHIPQGILSIGEDGVIESNYSQQLPVILGHDNIAHRSFKDCILDQTDLSADNMDQAWQSLLAIIDEESFSFDINEDKLPKEFNLNRSGEWIRVRATWNMELDSEDKVSHLLVTILDVTEEWKARKELNSINEEFEIIGQLVEAGAKKTSQFISSAQNLLAENEYLLETHDLDQDTLKVLFVNAHTIKGGARTLRFKSLTDQLHQLESKYSEMLQGFDGYEKEDLREECRLVHSQLDRLVEINGKVLGRNVELTKVTIEREFLENCFKVFCDLKEQQLLPDKLKTVVAENADQLLNVVFSPMNRVLEEIFEQSGKIAKDLAKPAPEIAIHCPNIMVSHQQESILRNCMIHLLRNSLDHGVETAEARKAAGKPEAGSLEVNVEVKEKSVGDSNAG